MGGAQPTTFRRMLVNTCQDKFEDMMIAEETDEQREKKEKMDPEELKEYMIKQKRSALATMKFIGHLFLRQLLAAAVIRQVVGDLLNNEPPELQVEYALELLQAVGPRFEETEKDKHQLSIILDRLNALKVMKGADGKACLSKRVQFQIQDLVDLRANKWKGRGFKETAKTMDEVREQAEAEEHAQNSQAKGGHHRGGGGGHHGGGGYGRHR